MIVLDASFTVKLVIGGENSEVARKLFRKWIRGGEIIATVNQILHYMNHLMLYGSTTS
ncbi:hypothetical protein D1872_332210 [compost metagenome]